MVADIHFLKTLHTQTSLYKEAKFIDDGIDKWANLPIHKECYFKSDLGPLYMRPVAGLLDCVLLCLFQLLVFVAGRIQQ